MYVSLTSFLIGWALYLVAPLTLLGPLAFVAYITRFQIIPEERASGAYSGSHTTTTVCGYGAGYDLVRVPIKHVWSLHSKISAQSAWSQDHQSDRANPCVPSV